MYWHRSSAEILDNWQLDIDHALETGQRPVLMLGESGGALNAVPGILALHKLVTQRNDASAPYALIGDGGPTWLWALWQIERADTVSGIQAATLVFGGADQATLIASSSATHQSERSRSAHWLEVYPLNLAAHFAPAHYPAAAKSFDKLPMLLLEDSQIVAPTDAQQDWSAWLAVALIVMALALSVVA